MECKSIYQVIIRIAPHDRMYTFYTKNLEEAINTFKYQRHNKVQVIEYESDGDDTISIFDIYEDASGVLIGQVYCPKTIEEVFNF